MSRVYHFKRVQHLPVGLGLAWDFFSSPANLRLLTPAKLCLVRLSEGEATPMYPGQLIEYTVRPYWGIAFHWITEITGVEHQKSFVDEQRKGPFALWRHEHQFKETAQGIEMTDIVDYRLPLGILGTIAHSLFVKKQLDEIFAFRFAAVEKIFGSLHPSSINR